MFYWSQIPFVRICVPFILGIIIQNQVFEIDISSIYIGLIISVSALIFFILVKSYSKRYWFGLVFPVVFFLFGSLFTLNYNQRQPQNILSIDEKVLWEGEVLEIIKSSEKNTRMTCLMKSVFKEGFIKKELKIIVNLNDSNSRIKVGDQFFVQSRIQEIKKNAIPNQFDYSRFLKRRKVYYQTYIKSLIVLNNKRTIQSIAADYRNKVIGIYQKTGLHGNNLGVLVALTLGNKSYLDSETKEAFAHAGAMHILAVSGLHVGIVFLLFNSLFKLLPNTKLLNYLKAVFLLLIVWAFALLTGFAPSVQRAGCMFSIIILSKTINRSTNVLNSIFGSAFILLLLNPNAIFEVGFQLSYSAVLGIVLIHPILYSILITKNKFLNWIIGVMVVSLAAQLSTLPFTLYYFHQFPNWFLLVNLIVIPIAFALVALSIGLIVFYSVFSSFLGLNYLVEFLVEVLNYSILKVESFPFPYTSGIWINFYSATFIALFVLATIYWLNYANSKMIHVLVSIAIILTIVEIKEDRSQKKQRHISIYPYDNYTIAYVRGKQAEVITFFDSLTHFQKMQLLSHLESIGVEKIGFSNNLEQVNGILNSKENSFSVIQRARTLLAISDDNELDIKQFKDSEIYYYLINASAVLFNKSQGFVLNDKLIIMNRIPPWEQSKIDSLFPKAVQIKNKGFYQVKID